MQHYRTYLRGELGKFRSESEGARFLRSADAGVTSLGLEADPTDLARRFATQALVDEFVVSLDKEALLRLTAACGRWRGNGIERLLSPHQQVDEVVVHIDQVLLGQAEPRLGPVFAELGYRLPAIAGDLRVLKDTAYRDNPVGTQVDFPWCLARQEAGLPSFYRILDGMHRSIQLVRNGVREVSLCVIDG